MLFIVTDSRGTYSGVVWRLEADAGAALIELDPETGSGLVGKRAIARRILSPKLLRLRGRWQRDDVVLSVGWYLLPLLVLMRLRVLEPPRRLISMATFVHSPVIRRGVNLFLRELKTPELEFIVFSDEQARGLLEQVRMPADRLHRVMFRARLEPEVVVQPNGSPYIFTGGYSNRDYATLFSAVEPLEYRVIASPSGLNKKHQLPPNVELRADVPWDEFERLLAGCELLVLPLLAAGEASGQSVLNRAMRYLRPVVATRHDALIGQLGADYPGFVPAGDPEALRAAIEHAMSDDGVRRDLVERITARRESLLKRGAMSTEILAILSRPRREPGHETQT